MSSLISLFNFNKNIVTIKPIPPTGEELFVKNYFDESQIKYVREYKLNNLVDDTKSYRVADFFYLN